MKVEDAVVAQWRTAYREGYSVAHIAASHGVTADTVKRHLSMQVGERRLLPGAEVHIQGQRGRWAFLGSVGTTKEGRQFADFKCARTGRARTFYADLIARVHRG